MKKVSRFVTHLMLSAVLLAGVAIAHATDTDGDGVDDAVDNCPAVSNPDQLNSDNLLPNAFASTDGWNSNMGFQACSGDDGYQPCMDGQWLRFSFVSSTVSRSFTVSNPTFIQLSVTVSGNAPSDPASVTLNAYDAANALLDSATWNASVDAAQNVQLVLSNKAVFAQITRVEVVFSGSDSNVWAGNYGAAFGNFSLTADTGDACDTDDDNDGTPDAIDTDPLDGNVSNTAPINLWIKKLSANVKEGSDNDNWTAQYIYNADRRSGHVFNPVVDDLDLTLAGSRILLPAGSLVSKGKNFTYNSAKGSVPVVKVLLTPSTQTLNVSVSGTTVSASLPASVNNIVQLGDEQPQVLQVALDTKGKFLPTASYQSPAFVVAAATVNDSGSTKDSLTLGLDLADPDLLSAYDFDTACPADNKNCKHPEVNITLYDENNAVLLDKNLTDLVATSRTVSKTMTKTYTMKKVVKTDPAVENVLSTFSFASKNGALKLGLKNLVLADGLDPSQSQLGVAITIGAKTYFTRVTLFETKQDSHSWSSKISVYAAPMPL